MTAFWVLTESMMLRRNELTPSSGLFEFRSGGRTQKTFIWVRPSEAQNLQIGRSLLTLCSQLSFLQGGFAFTWHSK